MEKFDKDIDLLANSGRAKGVADFAVNFEPGGQAPLDARLLVPTKADLIKPETYVAKNYYKGMAVTIEADGTEYILMDISKITSPDYSGWKQRDSMSTSSSLPSTIITDLTNVTTDSTTATIHSSKVTKSGRDYGNASDDNIIIPSATTSTAGVMSAADKVNLDETLPNAITKETQDREDAIAALESSSNTSIRALEKKHNDFVATKGKANGFAPLDGSGLVPPTHLPSYVDDIIEVYATYDISDTGKLSNIKLYSDSDHAIPITGESGKIYLNITENEPHYQFRWSGTNFVDCNTSSLILGEVTGTAFDGGKGKELEDWKNSLVMNGDQVREIETINYWYRGVGGKGDLELATKRLNLLTGEQLLNRRSVPIVTDTGTGLMRSSDKKFIDSLISYTAITPIALSDFLVRSSKNYVDIIFSKLEYDYKSGRYVKKSGTLQLYSATNDVAGLMSSSEHLKLKQLQLIDVRFFTNQVEDGIYLTLQKKDPGTVQWVNANEPLKLPLATINEPGLMSSKDKINLDQTLPNAIGKLEEKEDDHIANKSNPHQVTKDQIGLGKVDNTTDLEKPISTATQNALNAKVQTVNITGSGNAITSASISGTVLTLTKGATYNNNSYSAGTNLSLSGNTFSLNSTISLTRVNASSGFYQTSDKRLKSDIKPLEHSLDDICSIPTDSFILGGKKDLGTIAQELEPTFPELVIDAELKQSDVPNPENFETIEKDGETYVLVKEVDYAKMSVLAIEGIKLLKAEIDELKKQLLDK